jgi:type II secretory pathway component PulF
MKFDELAFFNQQLAAMLREGIPLEGALRQLCQHMRRGDLRVEMEALEADLSRGVSLTDALTPRKLPEFYVQMVRVGLQSDDLPGVLLMLADYYQRVDGTWTRLKGLMVYPLMVLSAAFLLSCFLTLAGDKMMKSSFPVLTNAPLPKVVVVNFWAPPIFLGLALTLTLLFAVVPSCRRKLRWWLPAFKEAKLAQVAGAMGLMLKTGGNLGDALGIVRQMEHGTVAGDELADWQVRLAHGRGSFSEMAAPGRAFPPLFLWLVSNAGEDLGAGFRRAAEVYSARAVQRTEMFLYAALPLAILALGVMIACQIIPVVRSFVVILSSLSS